ncbi:MAG TPA: hypothetical protein VFO55_10540 [Gemmatimonadaceae bacterium]|nr:hypothetical protein [Gemmatimonadaceae bacterium]
MRDDTSGVAAPRGQRFYTGKPVGSESQFNPLSLVINGGYDQLRWASADRRIFKLDYETAAEGVWRTVTQPDRVLRLYGTRRFFERQLFPFSGKSSGGGQWVPNYQLHLFAGGMTGVRMTEWYEQHGTAHPELAAAATVTAWHVLTEMVENQAGVLSADAMADLLIFDPAAFLLWRNDWVQRTFSTRVQMTNWSGQPAITTPRATLQNMQQTTMLRAQTPWGNAFRPMTTFGGSFLLGISGRRGETDWISLAAGWDPTENRIIDPITGERTVTLNPNYGVFYDRDGSLLGAINVRLNRKERVLVNVYPGVVHFGRWAPGLFAHILDDGRLRFGIVPRLGIGIGVE